jgi:hypothetical protein
MRGGSALTSAGRTKIEKAGSRLRVTLTTPWGAVVELHPKGQGGNSSDLKLTYDEAMLPALSTTSRLACAVTI